MKLLEENIEGRKNNSSILLGICLEYMGDGWLKLPCCPRANSANNPPDRQRDGHRSGKRAVFIPCL